MKVPVIGESVTEVTLSTWLVPNGGFVKMDQPICEFESDKATLEFPAEATGKLIHVASEDDDLEIGALVAKIDTSVEAPADEAEAPAAPATASEPTKETETQTEVAPAKESYATGHPSPAAGKILAEKNIDPKSVEGSGKDGRITKADAIKASPAPAAEAPAPSKKESEKIYVPASSASFSRETNRKKMTRMRRTIAANLVAAKNQTAMLTTFNEVDLTEIIALRKKYQERFVEKYGIKLGFMSLFAKACAQVLMEMPQVNAQLDGQELITHDYVDISIAISTPTGLVVPPVQNVESLGFHEVEYKIKELAEKARNGTLTLEEMRGGTFTITNGGIFGSLLSTPILNRPQSAVLGMHGIKQRPVAINGEVKIRPMMNLALSYDHQVIDGSSSVTFLVKVIELLEDPMRLMMNL